MRLFFFFFRRGKRAKTIIDKNILKSRVFYNLAINLITAVVVSSWRFFLWYPVRHQTRYVGQGFFYYVFFLQSVIMKDSDKENIDIRQVFFVTEADFLSRTTIFHIPNKTLFSRVINRESSWGLLGVQKCRANR